MKRWQIVLDTNVLVSALRSNRGPAYRLLRIIDGPKFQTNLSVPLVLEYEETFLRLLDEIPLTRLDIGNILDYLCKIAQHREIYYLWRPLLKDPKDDMVLELAVTSSADWIVTYNLKDFVGIEQFGVKANTPITFLQLIGEQP